MSQYISPLTKRPLNNYSNFRYHRNIKEGWCPYHTGVKPAAGYRVCESCLKRQRERVHTRKSLADLPNLRRSLDYTLTDKELAFKHDMKHATVNSWRQIVMRERIPDPAEVNWQESDVSLAAQYRTTTHSIAQFRRMHLLSIDWNEVDDSLSDGELMKQLNVNERAVFLFRHFKAKGVSFNTVVENNNRSLRRPTYLRKRKGKRLDELLADKTINWHARYSDISAKHSLSFQTILQVRRIKGISPSKK